MGSLFSSESEILLQEISEKEDEIQSQLRENQNAISWNDKKIALYRRKNCETRSRQALLHAASTIIALEEENKLRSLQVHRLNELRLQLVQCKLTIEHDETKREVRRVLERIADLEAARALSTLERNVLLEKDAEIMDDSIPDAPSGVMDKAENGAPDAVAKEPAASERKNRQEAEADFLAEFLPDPPAHEPMNTENIGKDGLIAQKEWENVPADGGGVRVETEVKFVNKLAPLADDTQSFDDQIAMQ
jgi:hypothetical protein